jgi:Uma2 family endonuclease
VVEVLSTSTEKYDRGDKFRAYEQIDSLAEYVLIDQYRVRVEYFRRINHQEWRLLILTDLADTLELQSIATTIPLAEIYRGITFEVSESPTPNPRFKR